MLAVPTRGRRMNPPPRKRHPEWLPKPLHNIHDENLTPENKEFVSEMSANFLKKSPLKAELIQPSEPWTRNSRRCGLIGKKIGVYPLWLKNGKRVLTTLIQIIDNEVVKYIPPEEYKPTMHREPYLFKTKRGCLILGAENIDPQLITKEYSGIFNANGVLPKRHLMRFLISPNAALQPGTPLSATHFNPGEFIDIRGKT